MVCITDLLTVILLSLGCILLVVLIILGIKAMKTIKKTNLLIDDITRKSEQLDAAFEIIERSTGVMDKLSDKFISFITGTLKKIFHKTRRDEDYEEEE